MARKVAVVAFVIGYCIAIAVFPLLFWISVIVAGGFVGGVLVIVMCIAGDIVWRWLIGDITICKADTK